MFSRIYEPNVQKFVFFGNIELKSNHFASHSSKHWFSRSQGPSNAIHQVVSNFNCRVHRGHSDRMLDISIRTSCIMQETIIAEHFSHRISSLHVFGKTLLWILNQRYIVRCLAFIIYYCMRRIRVEVCEKCLLTIRKNIELLPYFSLTNWHVHFA